MGPAAADAVPALAEALKDQNNDVRSKAADALRAIGPAAADAVPVLVETLKDYTVWVQHSVHALWAIGPAAVPALAEALKDPVMRLNAAYALEGIGPAAVPVLVKALKDQNEDVRSKAADTLRIIGSEAADAVPALVEALKDQNAVIRRSAADALREIGPAAADAVPTLAEALKDQNEYVGMFDDESTPFEVATDVAESLREHVTKTQTPVDINPQDNRISLHGSGGRSLQIVVDGPNAFRMQDDRGNKSGGVQTLVTGQMARWSFNSRPCDKPEMVRRVKAWLSEQ